MGELTRQELLKLVEANRGPEGLDLSGRDLSGLDLGRDAIRRELENRGIGRSPSFPRWAYGVGREPEGINLRGVLLNGADLGHTNLQGARLWDAQLEEARLWFTNLQDAALLNAGLQRVKLIQSNLKGAVLSGASLEGARMSDVNLEAANMSNTDLRGAVIGGCNLRRANFQGARLRDVDLVRHNDLDGIWLFGAKLEGTNLTRKQLGHGIGEERAKGERTYYYEAREAYLALKNNFESIGRHNDASWAYVKERKMGKMMNHPRNARTYYAAEDGLSRDANWRTKKWWWFYFRRLLRWVADWLVELVCGYGESIQRVLGTLAAVYVLFTVFYGMTGSVVGVASGAIADNPIEWAIFSLGALTTMDPASLRASNNIVELIAGLQALVGIFLTGLLGFVVANRIRRS